MNDSSKRFFPVIYCIDPYEKQGISHALANTRTAMEYGASGVILSGQDIDHQSVAFIFEQVRKQYTDIWIGINFRDFCLQGDCGRMCSLIKNMCHGVNGIMIDGFTDERLNIDRSIKVFGGGVGFEQFDKVKDVVDVFTVNSELIGLLPEVSVIADVRRKLGDEFSIALSGLITLDNMYEFRPLVDDFIVTSGLTEKNPDLGDREFFVPARIYRLFVAINKGLPVEMVNQITENRFKPASKLEYSV